jgi:hypothetical protein
MMESMNLLLGGRGCVLLVAQADKIGTLNRLHVIVAALGWRLPRFC